MRTRLDSLILPDHIIEKMRDKINISRIKKIETGFPLCRKKDINVLTSGVECVGTKCQIVPKSQKCIRKDEIFQGFYHTHPTEEARPSFNDLIHMYRERLGCIGAVRNDQINCFIRKAPFDRDILMDIIEEYQNTLITRLIAKNEYEIRLREITNKLFTKIEIEKK